MEALGILGGWPGIAVCLGLVPAIGYWYWRKVWFFRNPRRVAPAGEGLLSPADGTVVYVQKVPPTQPVITIKQGVAASINDILRADLAHPKVLVGVFMSPFSVHYNRAPLAGAVQFIRHYPAITKNRHMGAMHLRTLLRRTPRYAESLHIVHNERTVTRIDGHFKGQAMTCYVVQIAGKSVNGIDSYVQVGDRLSKGDIFGMIRIGSQVDVVVPWLDWMRIRVKPGDKVRAGETVLIE